MKVYKIIIIIALSICFSAIFTFSAQGVNAGGYVLIGCVPGTFADFGCDPRCGVGQKLVGTCEATCTSHPNQCVGHWNYDCQPDSNCHGGGGACTGSGGSCTSNANCCLGLSCSNGKCSGGQPSCQWTDNRPFCTGEGVFCGNPYYQNGQRYCGGGQPFCCNGLDVNASGICVCPTCTPSDPSTPTLLTPANNSVLNGNKANLSWTDDNNWGKSCPTNNNKAYLLLSEGCTGSYLSIDVTGTTTKVLSNLNYGKDYCWKIKKDNGTRVSISSTFKFTTASVPQILGIGMTGNDVCGTGYWSGQLNNPSGRTYNPIQFRITANASAGDIFKEIWVAFAPANNTQNNPQNAYQVNTNVANARSLQAKIDIQNGNGVDVTTLGHPANDYWWDNAVPVGQDKDNYYSGGAITTGKVLGNGTNATVSGNTLTANFNVAFKNSFPSGDYKIYTMVRIQKPDGSIISSDQAIGCNLNDDCNQFRFVQGWGIDVNPPGPAVSDPLFQPDGSFNITYNDSASDVKSASAVISSNLDNSVLKRVSPNPTTINVSQNTPFTENLTVGELGQQRNYKDKSATTPVYGFRLTTEDKACNITSATAGADQPTAWILGNNGSMAFADISGIKIPDVVVDPVNYPIAGSYLTQYTAISGNSLPQQRISEKDLYTKSYSNEAVNPPEGTSWYDYELKLVQKNNKAPLYAVKSSATITSSISDLYLNYAPEQINNTNLSNIGGTASIGNGGTTNGSTEESGGSGNTNVGQTVTKKYFQVLGDLTINKNANCDITSIIFVSGNVVITPDFNTIDPNLCLIIAKGTINIKQGDYKSNTDLTSGQKSQYDKIKAMIISDQKITLEADKQLDSQKWDGLYFFGGVRTKQIEIFRNLNSSANSAQPAVIFEYNPAFIDMFKDDLASREYSIRETR